MPPPLVIGKPLPLHDDYARQAQQRDFWRRSDRARWDYATGSDAGGFPILPRHEREKEDRWQRRVRQATPRRYVGSIIDRYNDHVMRTPAERPQAPEGSQYAALLDDADGAGTKLPTLMRRSLRRAQVEGCEYLLADASDAGVYATAAEEMQAGKRGIVRRVGADQVVWWADWQGQVAEALIVFVGRDGAPFGWYVSETATQRIALKRDESGKQMLVASVEAPVPHAYGGCPLVRVWPSLSDDQAIGDDSQAAGLAESSKRIVNLESWLWEEHQQGTFTTPVFIGVSADEVKDVPIGPGMGLCLPGGGGSTASVDTLGADPAQAQSLRDTRAQEIAELYRLAGLSPGNPTEAGQPESGVAKAFAFNEVEAKLSAIADAGEAAENLVVKRLSTAFGWEYPGYADWPDSFAAPDLAEELERCIRTTTADLPPIIQRKSIEGYAAQAYALDPADTATLNKQLDEREARSDAQPSLMNPPAGRTVGT